MNRLVSTIYASSFSENFLSEERLTSENNVFQDVKDTGSLNGLIQAIVNIALPLAVAAALVLLIVAGYQMISSQGNPEKLNGAKEMATNAIIGLVFILLSVGILVLVGSIFDIEGLRQ
jgi:hypothetical protein